MKKGILCIVLAMVLLTGCASQNDGLPDASVPGTTESSEEAQETVLETTETALPAAAEEKVMAVSSDGIADGIIDAAYGMNGGQVANGVPTLSIPLSIQNAPSGTVCFAIYMDDPDAADWVHWMAVNIEESTIPENFSADAGNKAVQGTNDFGTVGYGGPAPPDKDHTYEITVYALDAEVALPGGFSKTEFEAAVAPHILATATLEGIYKK
ncbi:MAG: YbhB/YbcL family Raf kinase inhibitor-like protein [Eubacteriales bacterium]|nr:YbhB/YbcL family Raf kinase inhibitor-like protein [Eubacteriales bacterium]